MFRKLLSAAIVAAVGLAAHGADAAVKTQEIKYSADGKTVTGYIAYDDAVAGKRPGVIVVHEWWGHNAYARRRAELLAAQGYTAFALDMYGDGKQAGHPKDAKSFMMESMETADRVKTRFMAALDVLKRHATVDGEKTAAIGYCFGGLVVLNMARMGVDLDGVVSYHGNLTALTKAEPGKVTAKVRAFTGADDPFVNPQKVAAFKAEMDAAGVDYRLVSYPGTVHSFTNPGADAFGEKFKMPLKYNAKADGDSWLQTQRFFREIFK